MKHVHAEYTVKIKIKLGLTKVQFVGLHYMNKFNKSCKLKTQKNNFTKKSESKALNFLCRIYTRYSKQHMDQIQAQAVCTGIFLRSHHICLVTYHNNSLSKTQSLGDKMMRSASPDIHFAAFTSLET